jgi:hypothetical protein
LYASLDTYIGKNEGHNSNTKGRHDALDVDLNSPHVGQTNDRVDERQPGAKSVLEHAEEDQLERCLIVHLLFHR